MAKIKEGAQSAAQQAAERARLAAKVDLDKAGSPIGLEAGIKRGVQVGEQLLGPAQVLSSQGLQRQTQRSGDTAALLARLQGRMDRTGEESSYLAQLQEQSKGLGSRENQALIEQANADIARDAAMQSRSLRGAQSSAGLRGGAAIAQRLAILRNAGSQRGIANRERLLANVSAKQQGLQALGQGMSQVDNRVAGSIQQYGNTLQNEEQRQGQGEQALAAFQGDQQNKVYQNKLDKAKFALGIGDTASQNEALLQELAQATRSASLARGK